MTEAVSSKNRLSALEAVARAASELLELVQHKDEPPSSEHNQRLYNRGDVILVNEGPLWHLLGKLQALGAADETDARTYEQLRQDAEVSEEPSR